MRVLVVFGTRPEAIKLAPVVAALDRAGGLCVRTCATGQHRRLLDDALDAFGWRPHRDLDAMRPDQRPDDLAARILRDLGPVLDDERPDAVLVQGDTTSALVGALAAAWRGIPVAHVEAGLRSGDLAAPFPEEANRRAIDHLAAWRFAPTEAARRALVAEGCAESTVFVTGNTGIDAVRQVWSRVAGRPLGALHPALAPLDRPDRPLVLVTVHRREAIGPPMARICDAVARLARRRVRIALPVHPNPGVARIVRRRLADVAGVVLLPPLPYPAMVGLLGAARVVLTDSGGLQEEGPALGRRVLVCRERTERVEGVAAGAALVVGTDPDRIEAHALRFLDDPDDACFHGPNPYGDGRAAERIAAVLAARAARRAG